MCVLCKFVCVMCVRLCESMNKKMNIFISNSRIMSMGISECESVSNSMTA